MGVPGTGSAGMNNTARRAAEEACDSRLLVRFWNETDWDRETVRNLEVAMSRARGYGLGTRCAGEYIWDRKRLSCCADRSDTRVKANAVYQAGDDALVFVVNGEFQGRRASVDDPEQRRGRPHGNTAR
jgi:hypothetical protein